MGNVFDLFAAGVSEAIHAAAKSQPAAAAPPDTLNEARYLRTIKPLPDRLARVAAMQNSPRKEDRRAMDREIARLKKQIRAAREQAIGPT